jgi:hypothetical protein
LALLNYQKGNYAESELYCGDVLDPEPTPYEFKIKAKALFRRGCARIKMGKFAVVGKPDIDTAEADFYRALELDPSIRPDIEKKVQELCDAKNKQKAKDVLFPRAAENLEQTGDEATLNEEEEPYKHYGCNDYQALIRIREENLNRTLLFCDETTQKEKLSERGRVYTRILEEQETITKSQHY